MTIREARLKREQILQAGLRIFADKGYHAVNVEDLIRAADVSRATFYVHFKSKEDLFSMIVDRLMQEQSAYVLELQQKFLSTTDDIAGAFESIIHTIVTAVEKHREALRVFFSVVQGSGTRAEERFQQMQRVTIDHFTNMIQQRLEAQGYSAAASRALAYMTIGGLSYIGKTILYGEIQAGEIDQLVAGLKELVRNNGAQLHKSSTRRTR